jgi:CheY-like chemotaxis protein
MTIPTSSAGAEALTGRKILVVEDEMLIAMLLGDLLADMGCQVLGPVSSVPQALELTAREKPDAAVLDVNLGSERVYPVADALTQAAVPFVFVTGYGQAGLAEAYGDHATIMKPFDPETFGGELAEGLLKAQGKL